MERMEGSAEMATGISTWMPPRWERKTSVERRTAQTETLSLIRE